MLKDCCAIADNTVLAPETVVPPFTLFSGSPGTVRLFRLSEKMAMTSSMILPVNSRVQSQ